MSHRIALPNCYILLGKLRKRNLNPTGIDTEGAGLVKVMTDYQTDKNLYFVQIKYCWPNHELVYLSLATIQNANQSAHMHSLISALYFLYLERVLYKLVN